MRSRCQGLPSNSVLSLGIGVVERREHVQDAGGTAGGQGLLGAEVPQVAAGDWGRQGRFEGGAAGQDPGGEAFGVGLRDVQDEESRGADGAQGQHH